MMMIQSQHPNEPADANAEQVRAMAVHLLHELISARAQLEGCRRLYDYIGQRAGRGRGSGRTPLAIDVAQRSTDDAVGYLTDWLQSQIIGLYEPGVTTDNMTHLRSVDPPRKDD